MPYHNPASSLHFHGGTLHLHWARTPQVSSEVLHARESATAPDPSSGTNPYRTLGAHDATSIDHLPVEILTEIFLLCPEGSQSRFRFDPSAEPRRWRAPFSLCQVSRYWREIALSLSSLWCPLSVSSTPRPEFIKLWLARSRGMPLSLHLEAPCLANDSPKYHSHVSKMLDLFSNEMHRWRTISFVLDNNLARQFIATVDSKAQILEELELILKEPNRHTEEVSALLPSFLNLRKLSWSVTTSATSLRNIPFHQLTHIYMASRNSTLEVLTCLAQCTTAVEIHWHRAKCTDSQSVCKLPQITLLHLRSLYLQGSGDLAHILSRLTLPSLKYLRMRTISRRQDHRMLEDFFDRSSCPLQKFILQDQSVHQRSIVKYLTIPFLEKIPEIEVYLRYSNDVLREMQELKDSQNTPTFRRLQIGHPESGSYPAFTWK